MSTYGMMRSDIAQFSEMEFNYCILDEAQAIKNHSTSVSKVVRLMKAQNRLCLSGTPVENHLGDLWSQIEFLNPGLLGSATAFKKISKNLASDNKSLQAFAKALSPFILRRTKKEVLTELPDKTEQIIYCEMKAPQKKLYDELLENYQKNILGEVNDAGEVGGKGFQVLEALTRLRQTACHPGLIDDKYGPEYSSKIHNLMPLVKETLEEGHKCLIFSQYTSFLKKVRDEFDKEEIMYEYLDGQTPSKKRAEKVKKFQTNDKCKIFLISLKAGGTGLNLTAAQTVFILDPWWNPAAESQAIDRAHRMGQKNKVMAYRLVTHGTVEERVIELQEKKRQLSDAVLSGGASLGNLSLDDLNYLFGATGK
ncbi:MAG: DEAD/DEAH box helicase [Lentisphaeraceae bacterium]|nr:DEAD/DEAH box helicase [Lentisphaeraceae bacterium]